MATTQGSAEDMSIPQPQLWHNIEKASLQALATIKFSTESTELYPPLCKQHIWQKVLVRAVVESTQVPETLFIIPLMHGEVAYKPMESFTLGVDAAFRSTQFNQEELMFLRQLRLEQFLCNVPWGVLHAARAAEVINTLQEDTMKVTVKGEQVTILPKNWRSLFLKIFNLSPKKEGEGEKWKLQELFPSLSAIQKGQLIVKVGDCRAVGSKKPLRLLSSLFCLNTTSQYSISITFAKKVMAALNGQEVDWPLEFYEEFKAELITLHRRQQQDKSKVIKTAIGPHLTLLLKEELLLGKQEEKEAGFNTIAGLTMTERVPPPRKRRLGEEPGAGKLNTVVRIIPKARKPVEQGQTSQDTEIEPPNEEPPKRRVVTSAEKWQIPDSTSSMVAQISHTHRRLEQLLVTFTSKAPPHFIKQMDEEFHKIQIKALQQYNQGLRLKEALTTDENAVEKGLLHIEISTLKQQLRELNESYETQIEVSFDLQDQLATLEGTMLSLRNTHQEQHADYQQLKENLKDRIDNLAARDKELVVAQQVITGLQAEKQEQAQLLTNTQEELRLLQLATNPSTPNTPRSEKMAAHESDSNLQAGTSALHSMIDEMVHPTAPQQQAIGNLRKELAHTRRERDELRVTVDRIMESPRSADEGFLSPSDLPPTFLLPRTSIYHQLTSHITPFTSIMQCYQALKGLNLLVSRIPLLRPGSILTKPQFERIWQNADATARDTLSFMWAAGDLKLPVGVMEVVTASPPFYIGRFVLRTLSFIGHHHFTCNHHVLTPLKLPTLKTYSPTTFREIRDMTKGQSITFNQALHTLTEEDISICYEAVKQYTWVLEHCEDKLPAPYSIPQLKEYVLRVIKERETSITKKRFGTLHPRTILHTDH